MYIGLNAPVQGFTERGIATFHALKADCALWLPAEGPQDAVTYPTALNLVRLDNWHEGEDPGSYVGRVLPTINRWIGTPHAVFQVGNEPDLEAGHSGERFAIYASRLRSMVPGIKLTNPPLKAENTFLWLCGTLKAGDYANVHCYWQVNHAGDMENDNLGASYGHVLDCGRPVIVSEVNAVPASGQGNDGDVDWVSRDDQVGEWLAMAEADGVYAAMIFIADASPSWAGFDVGPASGAAIRRAYERYAVDAPVEPAPPPPVVHPPTPPPSVTLPWRFVQPCEAPIFQGSDGNFSHAGRSPGFYAIDYAPLPLSSSIYAVADGEVTYNAFNHPQEGQTGHTICITHADGFESRYCHLNQYWAPVGAHVVQSEVIGLSGAPDYPYPGANGFGSGPHLHFSILKWGRWVRVETLMAEGEMAPIGVTGSRIEAAEEVDMLVETGFDDAELERLWHGPKSERQCEAAPYHADWGIPQAWAAQLTAGRPLGFAVSGEESDEASGRVVQYFANGKITYFTGDDSVAIN